MGHQHGSLLFQGAISFFLTLSGWYDMMVRDSQLISSMELQDAIILVLPNLACLAFREKESLCEGWRAGKL
jgi:hypothetical protein